MSAPAVIESAIADILLALLEGTEFANAIRRNGKPCRIHLPDDPGSRAALVRAHVRGEPATLDFHADGRQPWRERVERVVLAVLCPAADGQCRWVGIDLDAADHGEGGLADPVHAMRAIAERAANAGLDSGLLAVRSRGGCGRHMLLILPEPTPLADAVLGVAALAAAAFRVAASDKAESAAPHAFRRADGVIARLGDAGAVELIPRSTMKPRYGWALALPGAGAFAAHGGGVIVDPFTDLPTRHSHVPRCDSHAWSRFILEALEQYARSRSERPSTGSTTFRSANSPIEPLDRVDVRTREFLDGRIPEGSRNASAFAASANLLGCGVEANEAEAMILEGATACGLPIREAKAVFQSAMRARARAGRPQ